MKRFDVCNIAFHDTNSIPYFKNCYPKTGINKKGPAKKQGRYCLLLYI